MPLSSQGVWRVASAPDGLKLKRFGLLRGVRKLATRGSRLSLCGGAASMMCALCVLTLAATGILIYMGTTAPTWTQAIELVALVPLAFPLADLALVTAIAVAPRSVGVGQWVGALFGGPGQGQGCGEPSWPWDVSALPVGRTSRPMGLQQVQSWADIGSGMGHTVTGQLLSELAL